MVAFTLALTGAGCGGSPEMTNPDPCADPGLPAGAVHDQWTMLPAVPAPRFYHGAAAACRRLYLIGGTKGGTAFDTSPERLSAQVFDPASNAWSDLPALPIPMIMPNVASAGNELFIVGNVDVARTFKFDVAGNAWVEKAPFPIDKGRGAAAVGVSGTKIYVAGGIVRGLSGNLLNTGVRQSTLFAYDTATDTWETLPEMPLAVGYAAGAVQGDTFWVMGGSTDLSRTDQILAYDIAARTWADKGRLPVGVSSATAGVVAGKIYLLGGIATSIGTINKDTLVLDPTPATWTTAQAMPTPRFGIASGVIGGRIYVPTGTAMTNETTFVPVPAFEAYTP